MTKHKHDMSSTILNIPQSHQTSALSVYYSSLLSVLCSWFSHTSRLQSFFCNRKQKPIPSQPNKSQGVSRLSRRFQNSQDDVNRRHNNYFNPVSSFTIKEKAEVPSVDDILQKNKVADKSLWFLRRILGCFRIGEAGVRVFKLLPC